MRRSSCFDLYASYAFSAAVRRSPPPELVPGRPSSSRDARLEAFLCFFFVTPFDAADAEDDADALSFNFPRTTCAYAPADADASSFIVVAKCGVVTTSTHRSMPAPFDRHPISIAREIPSIAISIARDSIDRSNGCSDGPRDRAIARPRQKTNGVLASSRTSRTDDGQRASRWRIFLRVSRALERRATTVGARERRRNRPTRARGARGARGIQFFARARTERRANAFAG